MTLEQKKFLERRLRKAATDQSKLKKLKRLLLRFGGGFLVALSKVDPDLPRHLERGFVTGGHVTSKKMKSSLCHQNVAAVWKGRRPSIVAIGTGYALSDDGLWRQHHGGYYERDYWRRQKSESSTSEYSFKDQKLTILLLAIRTETKAEVEV